MSDQCDPLRNTSVGIWAGLRTSNTKRIQGTLGASKSGSGRGLSTVLTTGASDSKPIRVSILAFSCLRRTGIDADRSRLASIADGYLDLWFRQDECSQQLAASDAWSTSCLFAGSTLASRLAIAGPLSPAQQQALKQANELYAKARKAPQEDRVADAVTYCQQSLCIAESKLAQVMPALTQESLRPDRPGPGINQVDLAKTSKPSQPSEQGGSEFSVPLKKPGEAARASLGAWLACEAR